MLRDQAETKN